ncbi:syntaxin-12-like [Nerophis ophidion]|uniref:syntaxin-12-like n=1 Tax=Nerophis ophidion TaxID=159077 RepID=UPI002AE0A45F|nr:syntaxin-12-like [Nerophis ophidion]XP_061738185.1 syntaxin-12-like [Nerophis ophidion]XP_061738186.1 syntaxin-12-like [Nerophis ophidion]
MSYGQGESYRPVTRDFNSLIQSCSSNIQKITQNTAQIKSIVNQLGTRQDTSELQDRLQQIQHYTNQLAKETNKHLKELGSIPLPTSPSEQRQQKIQRERLMNDFSAALNNFQVVQRRAAEKEKESVARARAGSRLSVEDVAARDEKLVSFDNQEGWGQMAIQTEETAAITEEDLELIKERETNIRQLESDIMDVNQIFKDLAVMIHDQGEMIDSIEANVENAEVHVERGTDQLQRAAYYQQKSRKKICILALVFSIALVILGIIIWQVSK